MAADFMNEVWQIVAYGGDQLKVLRAGCPWRMRKTVQRVAHDSRRADATTVHCGVVPRRRSTTNTRAADLRR